MSVATPTTVDDRDDDDGSDNDGNDQGRSRRLNKIIGPLIKGATKSNFRNSRDGWQADEDLSTRGRGRFAASVGCQRRRRCAVADLCASNRASVCVQDEYLLALDFGRCEEACLKILTALPAVGCLTTSSIRLVIFSPKRTAISGCTRGAGAGVHIRGVRGVREVCNHIPALCTPPQVVTDLSYTPRTCLDRAQWTLNQSKWILHIALRCLGDGLTCFFSTRPGGIDHEVGCTDQRRGVQTREDERTGGRACGRARGRFDRLYSLRSSSSTK